MSDIHGGDSRNERKDIRFNMVATSLFSFINMLSAQSDKMGTRNLFKKPKQDKTVQTSRDIARRHVARGLCLSEGEECLHACKNVRNFLWTLDNSEQLRGCFHVTETENIDLLDSLLL